MKEYGVAKNYLFVHLLSFPFWGLLYLLPIFLFKDLNATAFQVATVIALKPMVALLSPYWSQAVHGYRHRLLPNLYWANILKFAPFLLSPFMNSSWYFIGAFGLFMMLSRGTTPAWMELLKLHLSEGPRKKLCQWGSIIDYLGSALLPIPFGFLLDRYPTSWRWLLLATALLGILSTLFIYAFPKNPNVSPPPEKKAFWLHSIAPWRNCIQLFSKRTDFLGFQMGFFLGGAGLMIIHPILPKYFVDTLHLSYTGMLTAIAACKGIGFTLSSPLWVRYFRNARLFAICASVTCFAALFPILLISAKSVSFNVYGAYLIYGIMQGGSELSWKMSGSYFAKGEDSSPYTSVNVLMVGIRGLILPYLGSLLFFVTNDIYVPLLLGSLFSLSATCLMAFFAKKYQVA